MSLLSDKYSSQSTAKPRPVTYNTFTEHGLGSGANSPVYTGLSDKYSQLSDKSPVSLAIIEKVIADNSDLKTAYKMAMKLDIPYKVSREFFKVYGENGKLTTLQTFTVMWNTLKKEEPSAEKPAKQRKTSVKSPGPTSKATKESEPHVEKPKQDKQTEAPTKNTPYTNHYAFHKAITEKKTVLPIDHFLFYKSAAKEQKAGEDADYDHIDYPQQFSLEWIKKVNKSLINNRLSINDFKKAFAFVQQKKPQIQVMLSSYSKDALLSLLGSTSAYRYKSEKKDRVIDAVYNSIEKTFQLGTITFTLGENIHDAIAKKVEKTTQSDLAKYAEDVQKDIAEYKQYIEKSKKSLTNPETIEEFEYFLSKKPKSELTAEQLRRYDELLSSKILERREIEFTKKAEIKKVENVSEMKLIETVHTKYNYPLYVVQLQGRVEKDTYNELNSSAKKLGGWYSSFRGNGAIPGFQFKDKAQAEKFMALREGDITNIERKEEIKAEKTEARADKLRATAESMIAKADQELGKERLTNTYRRANMANNADSKALNQKRLAQTMLNIADAIDSGKAKYLNYISTTTQIELLESIVRDATRREHNEKYKDAYERRKHENDTATIETADYIGIGYYPSIYVETIRELIRTIGNKSGGKLLAQRWTRKLQDYSREQRYQVKSDEEMSELKRMVELLSPSELKYSRIHEIMLQFARLKAMKIDNDSMLREVVREFIMYRAGKSEQSKVTMLERSLAGKSNVGIDYFPTPKELAERMVEMADIQPGMSVLEPSAGNGNIADAIKNAGVIPDVIELSSTLKEILEAKGYPIVGTDFMEFDSKKYDRIVMNPPFGNSQDAQHIMHAYSLLNPGGRIVAIAGEGIFFRKDKKSVEFQEFMDEKNGVVEKLPEKTFTDKKLYSTTGANARLLVLDKPEEPAAKQEESVAKQEEAKQPKTKPQATPEPEQESEESKDIAKVVSIPITEIYTDEKRFQPREALNELNVQNLVNNFDPIKFQPVNVWRDENGKLVLIAGHHRFEAMKRLGRKNIPAVEFKGTARQAEDFAYVDNVSRTRQLPHENAKFLRRLRERDLNEKEIKSECQRLYHVECSSAWFLSFLHENGIALQEMKSFNLESDDGKVVSTLATWVGKTMQKFPQLTTSQENEIYKFAKENYGKFGKKFNSYALFSGFVDPILDKKFFAGTVDQNPINFSNIKAKSDVEYEIDRKIADALKEMKNAESALQNKVLELERKRSSGEKFNEASAQAVIKKYQDDLVNAQQAYSREVLRKDERLKQALESQDALFGLGDNLNPTYPTIPQSVAVEIGEAFSRAPQMDFVRLMKNPAVANTVLQLLKQHGIINSGNQSAWMIDSTTLTDNGITILRESLWKTIFPNFGTSDFPIQVSDKVLKNLSSFLKIRQNPRIFGQFEIAVQIGNEFAGNDDTVMFDDPLDAQEFAFLCPFLYDTKNDKFEWVMKKYLDWNGKTDRKEFLESLSGEIGHKKQRQSAFGLSDQYVWR